MLEQQCSTYLSASGSLDTRLFESSADCIKVIALNGRIRKLNPGASLALDIEDISTLHGRLWESMWPLESRELVADAVRTAAAGGRSQFGAACPTAKGVTRWWDVVVHPIRNDQGTVCEIMAISRDITELYQAREALREAARQKDEFLLLLAHELRNPLSAAGLAATMMESQDLDAPRVRQLAQVVHRQIDHMSTLVEDLIDLARVARGDVVLKLETFDMGGIITEVIEQLQAQIRAKRHAVRVSIDPESCLVSGDKVRLIQAVGNLLGNAARYTVDEGDIAVSVHLQQGEVHVTVRDNGVGIDPEDLSRIFERHMQVDRTSFRKESGLGLGLALVSKIAALHSGRVDVHSDGKNKGSTFVLILPSVTC